MAGKSRTCTGCGVVQPSPKYLERGYCEECGSALEYLSRAELKKRYPRLWDHLFDLAKRHVGDTGGYVREDGVIVTVQEIRAAAAEEMRERCIQAGETFIDTLAKAYESAGMADEMMGKINALRALVQCIRDLPAEAAPEGEQ